MNFLMKVLFAIALVALISSSINCDEDKNVTQPGDKNLTRMQHILSQLHSRSPGLPLPHLMHLPFMRRNCSDNQQRNDHGIC